MDSRKVRSRSSMMRGSIAEVVEGRKVGWNPKYLMSWRFLPTVGKCPK